MLILVYKEMPSDEIRKRLAEGALVPLARGVAENELCLRSEHDDGRGADALSLKSRLARDQVRGADTLGQRSNVAEQARSRARTLTLRQRIARGRNHSFWDMPMFMLVQAAIALALMAIAHKLFFDWALLIWYFGTVFLARLVGKAFPRLALWIGGALLGSPLYALGFLAYSMRSGDGDGRPGVLIFTVLLLLLVSALPVFFGVQMIKGAQHRGTWQELDEVMDEERSTVLDRGQ